MRDVSMNSVSREKKETTEVCQFFMKNMTAEIFLKEYFKIKVFPIKNMSFCHKHKFIYHYIFAIKCRRPLIFETVNSVKSNGLSLKYQRFASSGCKDIGFRKFEFAAKTQFLYHFCHF